MQLSLSYKVFTWHPLNNRLYISNQLISQLATYSKLYTQLSLYYLYSQLILGLSLISKSLVACNQLLSCSQITPASDWSHLFCTLGVFVQHLATFTENVSRWFVVLKVFLHQLRNPYLQLDSLVVQLSPKLTQVSYTKLINWCIIDIRGLVKHPEDTHGILGHMNHL